MRKKKETAAENPTIEAAAPKQEKKTLAKKKTTTTRKPRATKKKTEETATVKSATVETTTAESATVEIVAEETSVKVTTNETPESTSDEAVKELETTVVAEEPKTEEQKTEEQKTEEPKAEESAEVVEQQNIQTPQQQSLVVDNEENQSTNPLNSKRRLPEQELNNKTTKQQNKEPRILPLPKQKIRNIIELAQAPQRAIILTDQQIQQLSLDEVERRHQYLEETLSNVLDYDVVISDTNIWLELLVGHTSSHSDPRYNARLQFERQLEFISKFSLYRGGRFMMMAETYEEIDRFACMQDPTNHREADWTDNFVCLNAAARLAKRLILAQQRENRLRIEGIGAESHHAAFADPAIVRKVAELFAQGKKVLLLTNDASVAIRSLGICDDLQRHNNISDQEWDAHYAPLRPMVFTFDDLKLLDYYTRQYHYIQLASGSVWMEDVPRSIERETFEPLKLWQEAFRPGDKRKGDNLFTEQELKIQQEKQKQQQQQEKQKQQQQEKQKQQQQEKQKQQQQEKQKQQQQEKQKQQQQEKQKQQQQEKQEKQKQQQQEKQKQQQQEKQKQQQQPETPVNPETPVTSEKQETQITPEKPDTPATPEETSETPKTEKKPRAKSRRKPQKKQQPAPSAE